MRFSYFYQGTGIQVQGEEKTRVKNKNRGRSLPHIGFLLLAFMVLINFSVLSQTTKSFYFIGNSVTDAANLKGIDQLATSAGYNHEWGRNMIPGAPLEWIWDHPNDGISEPPYGVFPNALANYTWDGISLQPFDRWLDSDLAEITNFWNACKAKSPNVQLFVYERWPRNMYGDDMTDSRLTADYFNTLFDYPYIESYAYEVNETRDYFEKLTLACRNISGPKKMLMVPVGQVMYALNNKMKTGQVPGFSSIWQVYSDGIHMNNMGGFIAATTFYSTFYKADPRGMTPGSEFGTLDASFVSIVQQTVWDVVNTYKDSQGNPWSGLNAGNEIGVTGLSLSPVSLSLTAGQTGTITAYITPSNATNKAITWTTSNANVATVNASGLVTAVAAGSATITATTNSNNKVASASVDVSGSALRNPENPANTVSGLNYNLYNGSWSTLPDFTTLTPATSGTIANFDISSKAGADNFAFQFSGYINIPTDGNYTFYTSSDDGSKLYIGTTQVVNNDGLHGSTEQSGTIGLKAGKHSITVTFFEYTGGESLSVSYSGPSITKIAIPSSMLFRDQPNRAPTAAFSFTPTSGSAPLTVNFDASTSTDPDAGDFILGYEWDFGDGSTIDHSNAPSHTYTTPNTYSIKLRVMDSKNAYSTVVSKTLTVSGSTGIIIPAKIEAENYSAMSGIQTETTTDTGGGLNVGWVESGDWMDYAINPSQSGTYTLNIRVASPNSNTQLQVKNGNTVLATLAIPNTGGWQTWQTVTTNINLTAGNQTLRVTTAGTATGSLWNLNWLDFALVPAGDGKVVMEKWTNVSGAAVSTIPVTTTANSTTNLTSLEIPVNADDNYGVRIRGYIIPSITGSYNLYIASDDNGELWLSNNDQPAGKSKIAYVSNWTNSQEWTKETNQKSAVINLTAGSKYYFEALMKEATGGDNLAIGWTGPGISSITVIGSSNISSYTSTNVPVTNVTVSSTTTSVDIDASTPLQATVVPDNATNKAISWTSSDNSIATVSSTGVVTGKAAGSAIVTVTTQDGNKTASCAVTVNPKTTPTKFEAENATYSGGGVATDHVGYSGTGFWAWVGAQGNYVQFNITNAKAGSTSVTCRYSNGQGVARTMSLYVNGIKVKQVSFAATANWDTWTDQIDNVTLNAGVNTIKYQWDSGDNAGFNIDYISLSMPNNPILVTGITLSPVSASINVNTTTNINVGVSPTNATNQTLSWSSSNTSVATVDNSGLVSGIAEGTANITAKSTDGSNITSNVCAVTVNSLPMTTGAMTPGTNFWNIGWTGWEDYFATGVDWKTTTNPWNPTLISELQQAKVKCLRFMDWNQANTACVTDWSQRIPKTANHYNVENNIPCFVDNWNGQHNLVWNGGSSNGVAFEWQIDLCNRIGADIWINIPCTATADFVYQLANLLNSQLNSNLKIYVEWANEIWNWGCANTVYADQQAAALNLGNVDVGAYCDPWRKYCVYESVRTFEQFERVFGTNSSRLVKVIAGQVGYHWDGWDINHMTTGDLACLNNATINPNHITFNAYAVAPYMGGTTIIDERNAITGDAQGVVYVQNSLKGTGISIVCYEGGSDNYPDNDLSLTRDPAQEQIYVDYLTALAPYINGPFNQYCMYGGCWGLKNFTGEDASAAPKWRGWMDYWSGIYKSGVQQKETVAAANQENKGAMSIFPNPATSNIYLNNSENKLVSVTLYDLNGRQLLMLQSADNLINIEVGALTEGLYVLKIATDSQINTKSVIIKR
jgi:uncharacterized protein YjdB